MMAILKNFQIKKHLRMVINSEINMAIMKEILKEILIKKGLMKLKCLDLEMVMHFLKWKDLTRLIHSDSMMDLVMVINSVKLMHLVKEKETKKVKVKGLDLDWLTE